VEDQTRSLSEVAGLMGVSERTVRRWIKAGRLKAYKPGRDYRIPEAGLRAFIEESEISPKAQAPLQLELEESRGADEERPMKIVRPEQLKEHIARMEGLRRQRKHEMDMLEHERRYDPVAWRYSTELAEEGLTRRYKQEGVLEFVEMVNRGWLADDETRRLCQIFVRELDALKHLTNEARVVAQVADSQTTYEGVKSISGAEALLRDNDTQHEGT
jgi:excisionase family DNA binding protein